MYLLKPFLGFRYKVVFEKNSFHAPEKKTMCATDYLHLMLPVYFENPDPVLFLLHILLLSLLHVRKH